MNDVLDAHPSYMCPHHNKMQAIRHQYIECTSMRVGILNDNFKLERNKKKFTLAQLNSWITELNMKQITTHDIYI